MKKKNGVTLIELLVSIVILNILLFIAYPMYKEYVNDSYAEQAKNQMLIVSNHLDRIKGKFFTYEAALDSKNKFNKEIETLYVPIEAKNDEEKRFILTVPEITGSTYTIIATPTKKQGLNYGKLKLEYNGNQLEGFYDENNSNTWSKKWY